MVTAFLIGLAGLLAGLAYLSDTRQAEIHKTATERLHDRAEHYRHSMDNFR